MWNTQDQRQGPHQSEACGKDIGWKEKKSKKVFEGMDQQRERQKSFALFDM